MMRRSPIPKSKVLFVDDEQDMRNAIKRNMRAHGDMWHPVCTTSGTEALQLCDDQTFDLTVTDRRMLGMSRAELQRLPRDRGDNHMVYQNAVAIDSVSQAGGALQFAATHPPEQ